MKSRFLITLLILSFAAQQCAKQTAPTGGPKDETPPTLTDSSPANKETKFRKDKIELTFDEYIQLNNAREQIIITPSIGKKYEVTAKKNKATLVFNSPLRDSTTYNINFRECIQDLNEKNPAVLKIAFSTGDYLDSLSISGTVREILTDTEAKNYTVALTEQSDTFNIFKHQASWITLTDKTGNFVLENLKSGNYFIYAFDDKNKNLIVDSKSEKYGFELNPIGLTKSIDTINIPVFKLDGSPLKLLSAKAIFNYFLIRLSKGVESYTLEPQEKTDHIYSILEADKSSIKVYNTLQQATDSLQFRLHVQDSTNNQIDTLLYLKFNEKKSPREDINAKIEYTRYIETKSTLESILSFSKPIPVFYKDSIFIKLDSLTKITFTDEDLKWNQHLTKLTIEKKYTQLPKKQADPTGTVKKEIIKQTIPVESQQQSKPKEKYNELIFPKGTFMSVEIDTIQRLSQSVRNITPEETGVILTQVETNNDFIIQLIAKNNEVIEESRNTKNHKFENLSPSAYFIRLIIDLNKNGKWDPGNILTRTNPEPVIYYRNSKSEKEINLKANWEVGPLLISSQQLVNKSRFNEQ